MQCFFQGCEQFLKALRCGGTTFLSSKMFSLLALVVLGLSTPLSQVWAVASDQNQYLAESENLQLDFLAEELLEAGVSVEELPGLFSDESLSFEEKLVVAEYLIKVYQPLPPGRCKRKRGCEPPKPVPCKPGILSIPGCEPEPDPPSCKRSKIGCDPPKPPKCVVIPGVPGTIIECLRGPVKGSFDEKFPKECVCW